MRVNPLRSLSGLTLRRRLLLLFYVITLGATIGVGAFGYYHASHSYRERILVEDSTRTREAARDLDTFLRHVPADLAFLARLPELHTYEYWRDLGYEAKTQDAAEGLRQTLSGFLASRGDYYKGSVIDGDGVARISVRRDRVTGRVNPDLLDSEDMSQRPEFAEPMRLPAGQVYTSELTLSEELGLIERPLTPVVRFSIPVVGANSVRYGVAMLTLRAEALFEIVTQATEGGEWSAYLIDQKGRYLYHPEPDQRFGHLLGGSARFEQDHPGVLAALGDAPEALIERNGMVYSAERIHPNPGDPSKDWLLVGVVSGDTLFADLRRFQYGFAGLVVLVLLIAHFASLYYVGGLVRPLTFVTSQLQRLSEGRIHPESYAYRANDEIKQILTSTERLVEALERLAERTDAIAGGDLSGEVQLLSTDDRLGGSINRMTRILRENRDTERRETWFKEAVEEINAALAGDLTTREVATHAVSVLSRYLEAGRGVLYLFDREQGRLDLLGSFMFVDRPALSSHFLLGEGAVGQVALERKPIHLTLPAADTPPIVTGTESLTPGYVYTVPLLRDNDLVGVCELAAFVPFDPERKAVIDRAAEIIAVFLDSAQQRERVSGLLGIAERATTEAREQSVRLQEMNASLERQQQILEAQADELKAAAQRMEEQNRRIQKQNEALQQANAQVEEQQQQLQQQNEELQQANAQMEEQQQQLQQQNEELQQANAQMEEQQQALRQQAEELQQSLADQVRVRDTLAHQKRELEKASQYKSEFLANMSHELRTPLNSIILLSKMLHLNEDGHLNEEEVKRLQVIHQSGQDLLRLINDVLDLAKVEAGRMELHPKPLATSSLADELRDLFQDTATAKGLEFRIEDRIQGEFVTDRDKLGQVLRNFLSNAFKFTKQGGVRLVIDRVEGDRPIRFAVHDTGIGVPEDKQQLIFEAFQQVDGSISREFGGTGLGLSISSRFAELLGGHIQVESRPGEGSVFTLTLPERLEPGHHAARGKVQPHPIVQAASTAPVPPSQAAQPSPIPPRPVVDDRGAIRSGDTTLLIVDDDANFTETLAAMNHKLGYKTLIAATGAEALALAERFEPQGILLDLGLPDMDGTEVLHRLKGNTRLRRIPVYIVSGREKDAQINTQGIVGYLQKPVDPQQITDAERAVLAARVRRILLVAGGSVTEQDLTALTGESHVTVQQVAAEAPPEAATVQDADLVVVDLALPVGQIVAACQAVRALAPQAPLLLFGDRVLTEEEEASLRTFTDSLIRKSPQAEARVSANIRRFLEGLPSQRQAEAQPAAIAGKEGDRTRLKGRTILVVDDDPRNLFTITSALEQRGARVLTALNGRKALDVLQKQVPDLILMDIMMPELDGFSAIEIIKHDERLREVPVIALTAKALKADREKALESGADDYLAKPVDFDVLIHMADAWSGRKHG